MEPASTIIKLLGGPSKVAAIAGVHRTRVWNWCQPKEKGGTGGLVPLRHASLLLGFAKANGIEIDASDFIPPSDPLPGHTGEGH